MKISGMKYRSLSISGLREDDLMPSTEQSPLLGRSSPLMMRSSVVLPTPFSPSRP